MNADEIRVFLISTLLWLADVCRDGQKEIPASAA